jgi:hypothetical protein
VRVLTDVERHAILALAAEFNSDDERDQLLADLVNCSVKETAPDGSLLEFVIPGYVRPAGHALRAYRGKDKFPVEGTMKDADGAEMSVHLFADRYSRVYEFELDKHAHATSPVIKPDWSTFRVR